MARRPFFRGMAGGVHPFTPLLSLREAGLFCHHFAITHGGGIPLRRCVTLLQEGGPTLRLRRLAAEVGELLDQGRTLGGALQRCGGRIPPLLVSMIAIGEQSGKLHPVLEGLSRHYDEMNELRAIFLRQISYPLAVFIVAIAGIPLLRLVLTGNLSTEAVVRALMPACTLLVLYVTLSGALRRVPGLRRAVLRMLWWCWPLRGVLRRFALMRLYWALEIMIDTGFLPHHGLRFAAHAAGAPALRRPLLKAAPLVQSGQTITEALKQTRVLPNMDLAQIEMGETSGRLEVMLHRLGRDHYLSAVHTVRNFLVLLESLLIIALGGMIVGGMH